MNLFSCPSRLRSLTALLCSASVLAACGGGGDDPPQLAAPTGAGARETAQATSTWTKIANEGATFTVSGSQTVRFGAGSNWVQKVVSGTGICTSNFFGADPAVGAIKECDLMTATPAPPPVPSTGSITVGWIAPTTNADGSPLTDLAGFRVYYGTSSGQYTNVVAVTGSTVTSYVLSNLAAGTYYLVVKAVDTANNESVASIEVSKSIN